MGLPRADRRTLLRLMADELFQLTKLGAAFPPHKQQRSGLFWRLAAAYLEQPLTAVMLAGMSLRADADALWRKLHEEQRQRHQRQQGAVVRSTPAAPSLSRRQSAVATPSPVADKALPTPSNEAEVPAAGDRSSGSEMHRRKDKGERRRQRKAAAAVVAAAAEGGGSGQAFMPPGTAEPQPPAAKERKRKQRSKAGAAAGLPPAAEEAGAPGHAVAAEQQLPAAKKKRRQEVGRGSAAGGPASGPAPQPAAPAAAPALAAPGAAAAVAARPPSAKRRWRPEADAELLLLAGSAEQRQRVLGSAELDWAAVGAHFGRSARGAQAHFQVLTRASSAEPTAGPAAVPAVGAGQQQEQQQAAAGSGRTASQAPAGQLAGGRSGAVAVAQPVRAALNFGLPPPAGQQLESPPFVGVTRGTHSQLSWIGRAKIHKIHEHLASCASRAAAAAAHDVARIWCTLHGREVRETGMTINFPQLLGDSGLERQLRGLADVPALKTFLATWLSQRWPQLEATMLAGRAAALDRYIASTSRRIGISPKGKGWRAQITVLNKLWPLGTWATELAAGVVWDAANVWRSLHPSSSTQASQLYNHPELRLWEDGALVGSLRDIQSGEQLQVFVKAWAEQHLPTMLDRLA